jgi:hypothetical protein
MQPSESDIECYSYGMCHAHAIASVAAHGGSFIVFTDPDEIFWEGEDGDDDLYAVIHVMSVHDTPQGQVARDVYGDVPLDAALDIIRDRFERDVLLTDDVLDASGITDLTDLEDDGSRPLCALDANDLIEVSKLSTVKDIPMLKLIDGPSNTRISYTYRDADNYAVARDVVLKGLPGKDDLAKISEKLSNMGGELNVGELGYFVPGQIGLPDLQNDFIGGQSAWIEERDTPFHMIDDISPTTLPADADMPRFAELVSKISEVTWDEGYRPPFYGDMAARRQRMVEQESEAQEPSFDM